MNIIELDLFDKERNRKIPTLVYLPSDNMHILPVVIFGPGYQSQKDLLCEKPAYTRYEYLAEYFTQNGYAFISIQHDIIGDNDGLETLNPKASQNDVRKHLYERGVKNIFYVLKNLFHLPIKYDHFIVAGHSNGGDIAKYFANHNPDLVSEIIVFDARRCKLNRETQVRILMFEADDTETDLGVLPRPDKEDNSKRSNAEWFIIKPRGALHRSYLGDYITNELSQKIFKDIDWFLKENITLYHS